ncbi:MAG: hypothetical protein EPO64_05505, partial [Nitrospirae bacterium]
MDHERQEPRRQRDHQFDMIDLGRFDEGASFVAEPGPDQRQRADWAVPLALFVATVFTTLWAGAYQTNTSPLLGAWQFLINDPAVLWKGLPFAGTLLAILVTHE